MKMSKFMEKLPEFIVNPSHVEECTYVGEGIMTSKASLTLVSKPTMPPVTLDLKRLGKYLQQQIDLQEYVATVREWVEVFREVFVPIDETSEIYDFMLWYKSKGIHDLEKIAHYTDTFDDDFYSIVRGCLGLLRTFKYNSDDPGSQFSDFLRVATGIKNNIERITAYLIGRKH